jgi:5-formyltetrahydrofolate cyclo-ligase
MQVGSSRTHDHLSMRGTAVSPVPIHRGDKGPTGDCNECFPSAPRLLPDMDIPDDRQLRRDLKRRRAALTALQRSKASREIARQVQRLPRFVRARRIAAYIGANNEVDPMPLLETASLRGKQCYLPVLHPFRPGRLLFRLWRPGQRMRNNRFGIPEPVPRRLRLLPARHLDLALVPLLGFDQRCGRLGMGGGFYDRSFAFRRQAGLQRPALVGLAFSVQQVPVVPTRSWDVMLDMVITERGPVRRVRRKRRTGDVA